ncbi:siroheme decarboxylase subunit beta [Pseudorhodobacter aquimaris]|uniref:siroheme decarboxylase subunit beta n=1 Tax=Pseudorhodobacter aquimaris TaxID=687412 RepID=UPI00067B8040|nr:Lrp/AsnC family transcriptional regulator [Pseudorhodobacter aquimaris]
MSIDSIDRKIISATASGLPLTPHPYREVGNWLNLTEEDVMARFTRLQEEGIIRRIALAPNHYALGMVANGMSVWDVPDDRASEIGPQIGALHFVSHCYLRPRSLPEWPYNLFAMIHGETRDAVEGLRAEIAGLLGNDCRASDILYSTRILKKTGMRLTERA